MGMNDQAVVSYLDEAETMILELGEAVEAGHDELLPALEEQRIDLIGVLTLCRRGEADPLAWLRTLH
jgi:hypothetical protein